MSETAVVRNYAEALLELASRDDAVEAYGERLAEVAALYRLEEDVRRFLETPRITLEEKKEAVRDAWGGRAPEAFVRFLMVLLDKGRQRRVPRIEEEFRRLVDEREGRVHATVTLAREPDEGFREEIVGALAGATGMEIVPHFRVDEEVLGGVVIRIADHVMDGSLRRRLSDLEDRLLDEEGVGRAT